jgi:hypothetical protein
MHDGQWHLLANGRWYKDQDGYDHWWYQTGDGTVYQFRFLDGPDNDGHGQWEQLWRGATWFELLDPDAGQDFVFDGAWHQGHWTADGHWVDAAGSGDWYLYDGTYAYYWFDFGENQYWFHVWAVKWWHPAGGTTWYKRTERGASSDFIYDGNDHDIDPTSGVTNYHYDEDAHVGFWDVGGDGTDDFVYDYAAKQWQRWTGAAWENFADQGSSADFRYDGRDYLIGGDLWYSYDAATATGYWDYGIDGADFRYDYDWADRQWEVSAGGNWVDSRNTGASSRFVYDRQWHDGLDNHTSTTPGFVPYEFVYDGAFHDGTDGYWYRYHLDTDRGEWWSQAAGSTYYDYATGCWSDSSGRALNSSAASEDYIYDGDWHRGRWDDGDWDYETGGGPWFIYEGGNERYWFDGGVNQFWYYPANQRWWRLHGGAIWSRLTEAPATPEYIYDGAVHDMDPTGGVTNYRYDEAAHAGYWDIRGEGADDFQYNYGARRWQRFSGAGWENFADPGTSPDFRYDGRDYLMGASLWYTYDRDSNTGYWDYGRNGADFRYDYDRADRQWEVFAGGSWHESFGPAASSAFLYDGEWHRLADGDWYTYRSAAGEGLWWSSTTGSFYYDYETEQWYDGSHNTIFGPGTSEDFVFDGEWHQGRFDSLFHGGEWTYNPAGDAWLIFDSGWVYWWYGGYYRHCYGPWLHKWQHYENGWWVNDRAAVNTLTFPTGVSEDNGNTYTEIDLSAAFRVADPDDDSLTVELTALTGFDTPLDHRIRRTRGDNPCRRGRSVGPPDRGRPRRCEQRAGPPSRDAC